MKALRAATTVPAEYLAMTEDFGGIGVGRRADLVLLRDDPLADIRNTTSVSAVLLEGRLLDRHALDAMLSETASLNSMVFPNLPSPSFR